MIPKPKDAEGKITLNQEQRARKRLELCEKQGWRCRMCGTILCKQWGYFNSATLDHIQPEKMGQKKRDNDDNLQVLCARCNGLKGSKRS